MKAKSVSYYIDMVCSFTNKHYLALLLAIVLFGIALRSVEVASGNYLFTFDQGRDYTLVKEIVESHKLRLIGLELGAGSAGISGFFHGPGYLYLLAIPYVLFKGDPYGSIVLMFVLGVSSLFISVKLGQELFGKTGSLLLVLLFALSPPIVAQSRFLWNTHPSTPLILITLFFIHRIPRKPQLYLPLSFFTAGLIYHFQLGIAIPLVFSIALYSIFVLKIRNRKAFVYSATALLLVFMPFFLFEIRHDYLGFHAALNFFKDRDNESTLMFEYLVLKDHLHDYWYNFTKTFSLEIINQNKYVHAILALATIYGLIQFIRNNRHKNQRLFALFLILIVVTTWIALHILLKNRLWDHYLVHLHIAYLLLVVYACKGIMSRFHKEGKYFGIILLSVLLLIIVSGIKRLYISYAYDFYDYGGIHKMRGNKDAVDLVYQDANEEPFSVFIFSPYGLTQAHDYVFQWYGNRKYGYEPDSSKKGQFYLFIEKNESKPWTYQGWKETVIIEGEKVWEKQLPSGFIIEKRVNYPNENE